MKFQYVIKYFPGKELYTPDSLSRAPLHSQPDNCKVKPTEDIKFIVQTLASLLPANNDRLNVYCQTQASEKICTKLIDYCRSGWPSHKPKGELGKH